jgi:hypothetical protein
MDNLPEDLTERDQRLGEIVFNCLQSLEQGEQLDPGLWRNSRSS